MIDFSIIVPTHNRPACLRECLQAICELDYPHDRFEALVVDDGGDAPLQAVVEPFAQRVPLRLLVEPHRGPAAARNAGATQACGRYLAFTDDDCAPARDWLSRLQRATQARPEILLGGRTVNAVDSHPAPLASQLLIDYLYEYFNSDPEDARFVVSCNLAVPAEAFRAIDGFDTRFPRAAAEDRDLCDRWLASGRRMAYVPDAVVLHRHHLSLPAFWRQHMGYGRGAYHFHQGRRFRQRGKLRLEPLRFYSRLLVYPFRRRLPGATRLSALLALSQVANAAGFFEEAVRGR
jgi:GT2 family glycosyltransferase